MSQIQIAFRAESVGPVVKRIVAEGDGLQAIHEDDLDFTKLVSVRPAPPAPLPAPPDPLAGVWERTATLAHDFSNLNPTRSTVAQQGIDELIRSLTATKSAMQVPAPVAPTPPPAPAYTPNVLVRWGSRREGKADIEINSAASVSLARDKKESRRALQGLCPTTWFRQSEVRTPCVIRPRRHHAGKKFFVCNSADEVNRAILRCGPGWYASELIDKAHEYRVFILQDRVIRVSTKHQNNPGEVAWNVGTGANAIGLARKNWNLEVVKVAVKAARKLNLDFTAVDVCVDKAGKPYVLEANTAPGLQSGSKALEQIAWAFGWVPKNAKPALLNLDGITRWQDVLHPSLLSSAEETN